MVRRALLPLLLVLSGIVAATSSKASLNFFSIVVIIGLLAGVSGGATGCGSCDT